MGSENAESAILCSAERSKSPLGPARRRQGARNHCSSLRICYSESLNTRNHPKSPEITDIARYSESLNTRNHPKSPKITDITRYHPKSLLEHASLFFEVAELLRAVLCTAPQAPSGAYANLVYIYIYISVGPLKQVDDPKWAPSCSSL